MKRSAKLANHYTRLIKKKREKTQITKIKKESEDITTNTTEIERIIKEYYKQLYNNKLHKLDNMKKFLETTRLNHEEIENLNRPKTSEETELVIKITSTKNALELMALLANFTKHLKK